MAPTLNEGQLVLARKATRKNFPKIGDIVIIDHPTYGQIVKRIDSSANNKFIVRGDGVSSTISADLGHIDIKFIKAIVKLPL